MRPASDSPAAPGLMVVNATQAYPRQRDLLPGRTARSTTSARCVRDLDVDIVYEELRPRPALPARYVAPHEDPAWPPPPPYGATDVTRSVAIA